MRLFILVLVCALLAGCGVILFHTQTEIVIESDEIGVVENLQTHELEDPLQPGTYSLDSDLYEVYIYPTGQLQFTFTGTPDIRPTGSQAIRSTTSDQQTVILDATILFQIDPLQINRLHNRWQDNYMDATASIVRAIVTEKLRDFTAYELYTETRADFVTETQETVQVFLEESGLIFISLTFRDIQFEQQTINEIEATIDAQLLPTRTATPAP